jgi:hypothetical protein
VSVHRSPAHEDGAWVALTGPHERRPLQAAVAAVDPHLDVETGGTDTDWHARVVRRDAAAEEFGEVAVAKVSGGAVFAFQPRKSLPLRVV